MDTWRWFTVIYACGCKKLRPLCSNEWVSDIGRNERVIKCDTACVVHSGIPRNFQYEKHAYELGEWVI